MLVSLRSRPVEELEGPAVLLRECHGRIRHFTQVALTLPGARDAPPGEIREAASLLRRYFTVALPLHSDDEDASVRPRLLAAAHLPEVADALDTIAAEHVEIHGVIARLDTRWSEVARDASALREHARALADDAEVLRGLWDRHLALEERVVFPAVEKLERAVQDEIRAEMRARRPAHAYFPAK